VQGSAARKAVGAHQCGSGTGAFLDSEGNTLSVSLARPAARAEDSSGLGLGERPARILTPLRRLATGESRKGFCPGVRRRRSSGRTPEVAQPLSCVIPSHSGARRFNRNVSLGVAEARS
jgi:hypothetical protein